MFTEREFDLITRTSLVWAALILAGLLLVSEWRRYRVASRAPLPRTSERWQVLAEDFMPVVDGAVDEDWEGRK